MKTCVFVSILLTGLFVSTSLAAEFYVNPGESIQAAINAAVTGDRITVSPGIYYENIHIDGKNITLTSTDPNQWSIVESTILDGNAAGSVVMFGGTATADCILRGLAITHGYSTVGAAIHAGNSYATIERCAITANTVNGVGGIVSYSRGKISQCRVYGNTSTTGSCAGFNLCGGTITDCRIYENTGGGLASCSGDIEQCTVTGNTGGGLYMCNGLITNCIISENQGGGLSYCDAAIRNCRIIGNHSATVGGGLAYCDGAISNCTIYANTTSAPQGGSGLAYCYGTVTNCIIWENDILMYVTPDPCWTCPIVFWYNCIQGLTSHVYGNTGEDPLFVDPNGVDGIAGTADDDLHLLPWSPCIDAGDPAGDYSGQTDMDGQDRVLYDTVDMGADEVFPIAGDVDKDGDVDLEDFSYFAAHWLKGK